MEGFVHPYAVSVAAQEFKRSSYRIIYTTGGPVAGSGGYTTDHNTAAGLGASRLEKAGVPPGVVQVVASRNNKRDRTYASALALRDWFQAHKVPARSFNIITDGAHARRTRLLFQEAFGSKTSVGIIAARDPDYDPDHWWLYSDGVRDVIGESIAYLYAKFFFWPSHEDNTAQ